MGITRSQCCCIIANVCLPDSIVICVSQYFGGGSVFFLTGWFCRIPDPIQSNPKLCNLFLPSWTSKSLLCLQIIMVDPHWTVVNISIQLCGQWPVGHVTEPLPGINSQIPRTLKLTVVAIRLGPLPFCAQVNSAIHRFRKIRIHMVQMLAVALLLATASGARVSAPPKVIFPPGSYIISQESEPKQQEMLEGLGCYCKKARA